jgi:hypothetical protein
MEIHHHHHHHMALQPNSGPGLPFWGFVTITFLQGWIVSPAHNPQPGGPDLRIYDPRRQGGPATPQALGTHFSRLLRHAWVTVGLFFNPGHHTGDKRKLQCGIKWNEECSKLNMTVFWDVAPMMKAVSTAESEVDNYFTRQYIPEDKSELHTRRRENLKSHIGCLCCVGFGRVCFGYSWLGWVRLVWVRLSCSTRKKLTTQNIKMDCPPMALSSYLMWRNSGNLCVE